MYTFVSQLQLVTRPPDYNYHLLIISVKFVINYKTVIFQQISLGSSTYTCPVGYCIPVPGLPIQFLVLHRKDMHSSMIAGDTEPWGVVVEIYTVNNMSLYNKPSTQEKCTVNRIYTKHNIVNKWVLSFCIYALLTASCHCWKHLWKPTPTPFFLVQMSDLLLHSIQFLLWTQNNVLWANFQSMEQAHIVRCRNGKYNEGRMVIILSLHKNCCTVRKVWQGALSWCRNQIFLHILSLFH